MVEAVARAADEEERQLDFAAEAERDKLKAELEELDFLRHEGGPDRVAAIEAERDRMREVLKAMAEHSTGGVGCNPVGFVSAARAALAQEPS
jgi:hypothetical protein